RTAGECQLTIRRVVELVAPGRIILRDILALDVIDNSGTRGLEVRGFHAKAASGGSSFHRWVRRTAAGEEAGGGVDLIARSNGVAGLGAVARSGVGVRATDAEDGTALAGASAAAHVAGERGESVLEPADADLL